MDAKTSVLLSQQKQFFIDARSRPIGAKDKNNQDAKRRKCVGQSGGEKLQSHPGVQHSALTLRTVCLLLENVESQESIGAEPPQLLRHCYAATLFSFWRQYTRYSETHFHVILTGENRSKVPSRLPCIQSRRNLVLLGLLWTLLWSQGEGRCCGGHRTNLC